MRLKLIAISLAMHAGICAFTKNASAHLNPTLGRWMQEDHAGYVAGESLFEYLGTNPCASVDPFGLVPVFQSFPLRYDSYRPQLDSDGYTYNIDWRAPAIKPFPWEIVQVIASSGEAYNCDGSVNQELNNLINHPDYFEGWPLGLRGVPVYPLTDTWQLRGVGKTWGFAYTIGEAANMPWNTIPDDDAHHQPITGVPVGQGHGVLPHQLNMLPGFSPSVIRQSYYSWNNCCASNKAKLTIEDKKHWQLSIGY